MGEQRRGEGKAKQKGKELEKKTQKEESRGESDEVSDFSIGKLKTHQYFLVQGSFHPQALQQNFPDNVSSEIKSTSTVRGNTFMCLIEPT